MILVPLGLIVNGRKNRDDLWVDDEWGNSLRRRLAQSHWRIDVKFFFVWDRVIVLLIEFY